MVYGCPLVYRFGWIILMLCNDCQTAEVIVRVSSIEDYFVKALCRDLLQQALLLVVSIICMGMCKNC